jgi:N-acetylneuraminate synthase
MVDQQQPQCLVIGEVAQAHDGSLGTAHAFIDAIANARADGIKLQTHIAAAESTPGEPWRVNFSYQDATRYDYWKRMEFTEAQWQRLRQHAKERGLLFISSPFSLEAVDLLLRVGVDAWKQQTG